LFVDKERERVEKKSEIKLEALKKIKVKVKSVSSWKLVWTSEGTGASTEVSIWAMQHQSRWIHRNKGTVEFGHYAAVGFGKKNQPPSSLKGFTIELTDTDVSMISKSSNLDEAHVNYLMPYPVAFKMVWWHQSGNNSICILRNSSKIILMQSQNAYLLDIWRPIPPNSDFVAIGVVATTTSQEPPLHSVRTINKGFLVPSKKKPLRTWDSLGIGGKKGSFWTQPSLGVTKYLLPEVTLSSYVL
jgi:hypothetical protein